MNSEEVFDFSTGQMTQAKIRTLKETLNHEFALVFELCQFVLTNSQNMELLVVCTSVLSKSYTLSNAPVCLLTYERCLSNFHKT